MELESLLLNFVHSIQESNFNLLVQMLQELCPWLFALELIHYSRWVPVLIKTLEDLLMRHPQVYDKLRKGHFTSWKTNASFSAISDDHLHEQNNKTITGAGGAVDILGSETALLKLMVAGPEIARMVHEFEQMAAVTQNAVGITFIMKILACLSPTTIVMSEVVKLVCRCGNPFAEQQLHCWQQEDYIIMTGVVAVGSLDPA